MTKNLENETTMTEDKISRTLFCARSGTALCIVTPVCSFGWPMILRTQEEMIHPVYSWSLDKLLKRFGNDLSTAEDLSWECGEAEKRNLALQMSAIMYALGGMWIPEEGSEKKIFPSLPAWHVVTGSGRRLQHIAQWYHFGTSKRIKFPRYRVTKANLNLQWENFRAWLDEIFDLRAAWEKGKASSELQHLVNTIEELEEEEVSIEKVYAKLDQRKIWAWVDVQLSQHKEYGAGRRQTFKELYLRGDISPQDWTVDDVEDLQFAILECCDTKQDVVHFINRRLNGIKAEIKDFYGNFIILGSGNSSAAPLDMSEEEKQKTEEFLSGYDSRASALEELPPAPRREQFGSLGLFLKAQAQHRILARRFELVKQRSESEGVASAPATAIEDTDTNETI